MNQFNSGPSINSYNKLSHWFDFTNPSAVKIRNAEATAVIPGVNGGNPIGTIDRTNALTDVTDAVDWCSGNVNLEDYYQSDKLHPNAAGVHLMVEGIKPFLADLIEIVISKD